MRTMLAVVVALFILGGIGCKKVQRNCDDAWAQDVKRCEGECQQYGATFVRLTPITGFCNGECWCRRGAEAGGGSEPLRIW